jgi:hypothetical protein
MRRALLRTEHFHQLNTCWQLKIRTECALSKRSARLPLRNHSRSAHPAGKDQGHRFRTNTLLESLSLKPSLLSENRFESPAPLCQGEVRQILLLDY